MRATGMVTTVVGLALLLAAMPDAGGVSITEKGGSAYVIVVADNAPETVAAGAEELQTYLERISGARLAIVKEREHDGGLGLYLGATKRAEAAGVAIEQGRYPVRERYVIRSVDDDLLLLGNDAWRFHGTCCAVYDLLHQLGCRWYMPGAKGEIVPETPTISLEALNVDESPDFIERSGVWYEYHSENPKQDHAELEQWRRRNRMGERWLPCGHNLARLMPVDPYFKEHPEWFPLINGERRDKGAGGGLWHPCVGNEAFRAFIAERLVEQFAADPAMRAGSLGLNDATWEGWCRCEACGKMGATKDGYRNNHFTKRYLRFVDDVARRVDEKAPGRLIAATAYASTQVPPTDMAPLNDNVFVVVMHYYWSDQCKPLCDDPFYKGVFEGFAELAPDRLGVYQYYGDFHYDQLPTPAWAFLRDEFDFYRETGVRMMTIEGGNQWAANGLTYYVNARMAWDSDLDPNAVVDEFCANFFGPAAKPMREYFDLRAEAFRRGEKCERNPRKIPYAEYLDRFDKTLEEAAGAAPAGPYRERVAFYERYQHYVRTYYGAISALEALKNVPCEETTAAARKAIGMLTEQIDKLGDEGALAKPSAQHYTLGWMNKRLDALTR